MSSELTESFVVSVFNLKNTRIIGEELMASCPFADKYHNNGDKNRSFGINLSTGMWNCFTCSIHGSRGRSLNSLAYKLGIWLDPVARDKFTLLGFSYVSREVPTIDYPEYYKEILTQNKDLAYNELKHRGITKEAIEDNYVGYHSTLNTIYYLDVSLSGKLYGWVEWNKSWKNRYSFGEDVFKLNSVYGLNRLYNVLFLVEGPTDKLKINSFGFGAASIWGNQISKVQAKRILSVCNKVILVPDRDEAGINMITSAKEHLYKKISLGYLKISKTKDVGDSSYSKKDFYTDCKNVTTLC